MNWSEFVFYISAMLAVKRQVSEYSYVRGEGIGSSIAVGNLDFRMGTMDFRVGSVCLPPSAWPNRNYICRFNQFSNEWQRATQKSLCLEENRYSFSRCCGRNEAFVSCGECGDRPLVLSHPLRFQSISFSIYFNNLHWRYI